MSMSGNAIEEDEDDLYSFIKQRYIDLYSAPS